mgnify:FL=1
MSRVNHPAHYGGAENRYEAIKVIDAWRCNFNTGNAYKYMARAGLKLSADLDAQAKLREDIEKARWYLTHQLERLHAGCLTALTAQPMIPPSGYSFDEVMVGARLNSKLAPAFLACYNQCTAHRVEAGLDSIETFLGGLL